VRPRDVAGLAGLPRPELDRIRRVLSRAHSIGDLKREARKRLPRAVFDYIDGGSDEEITLAENRAAFTRRRFVPRVLTDVSQPELGTEVFGARLPAPLGLAPTGYTRMIHPEGELAVARAAQARQLPYVLSTVGTASICEVAATGLTGRWFQLYVLQDRGLTRALLERAASAGYRVLEVSLDTAVAGHRVRDVRNGLVIPPRLSARAVLDLAAHPGYWLGLLRGPALRFPNLAAGVPGGTVAEISALFDPSFSWADLAQIRRWWTGPLLVKGPVSADDARRAMNTGADGIHLSNHGGRQLDRCLPAVELVRPVREAVGDQAVIVVDSGVRHGADIAIAVALGADLAMAGRAYLYGLAAAGQAGVERSIDILVTEFRRTMQLLGVRSVADLREHGGELVRQSCQG
jgi:L-lactate dehydrogenase (cytochrome)